MVDDDDRGSNKFLYLIKMWKKNKKEEKRLKIIIFD